jgi:L-2-hydroxyglutarate oxidase LhgO
MSQVIIVGAGIVGLILGQVLKLVRLICVTRRERIVDCLTAKCPLHNPGTRRIRR